MENYKKNKRTYENNAIQIEIADDLETMVRDKRLGMESYRTQGSIK